MRHDLPRVFFRGCECMFQLLCLDALQTQQHFGLWSHWLEASWLHQHQHITPTWSVWPLAEKPTNELTVEGLVTISFTLLKITSRIEWAVWVGELFQLGLVFSPKQPQSSPECKTGLAVVPVFHFWQDRIGRTVSFSILITSGTPRPWGCSVY